MLMRSELEAIHYASDESKVVYPQGDKIDVKQNEYETSDTETATGNNFINESTVGVFGNVAPQLATQTQHTEYKHSQPCAKCNAPIPCGVNFCANCSTDVQQILPQLTHERSQQAYYQQPPQLQFQQTTQPMQPMQPMHAQSTGVGYNTPQIRAMIGNNADYYVRKFSEMEHTKSNASWNWPAFLFNWIWMLHRGMTNNPMTWVMLGLSILALFLYIYVIGFFISIVCCIVSGILGNSWYKKQIDDKLKRMNR